MNKLYFIISQFNIYINKTIYKILILKSNELIIVFFLNIIKSLISHCNYYN